ncbi:MAG: HEAT repeat domain-containing protein [Chloroflexi bacterium]|nr:MAG: HEAT repeat domain-containing protein [Chloroflexota bacterium]
MGTRTEEYRAALRRLKDWEPYLKKHSGLPGPRANLELLAAVVEEADADRLWRLSASADEYLATVGTAGLGRIALMEPETVMTWLRELSSDPRWRVREGVAMALQRLGKESMPTLLVEMRVWAQDDAFVQRAVVAGLCEPALLKSNEDAVEVLDILDHITRSLAAASDRRREGFRVLRQALGYGWSIAAAAAPQNAKPYLEKWLTSTDKDVAWVMQSNLGKSRMSDMTRDLATAAPVTAKPKAKAKPKPKPKPKPKAKPATRKKPAKSARGRR